MKAIVLLILLFLLVVGDLAFVFLVSLSLSQEMRKCGLRELVSAERNSKRLRRAMDDLNTERGTISGAVRAFIEWSPKEEKKNET